MKCDIRAVLNQRLTTLQIREYDLLEKMDGRVSPSAIGDFLSGQADISASDLAELLVALAAR